MYLILHSEALFQRCLFFSQPVAGLTNQVPVWDSQAGAPLDGPYVRVGEWRKGGHLKCLRGTQTPNDHSRSMECNGKLYLIVNYQIYTQRHVSTRITWPKSNTPTCEHVRKLSKTEPAKISSKQAPTQPKKHHQENSNHVAGLESNQPDASRLSECEWWHNTLLIS